MSSARKALADVLEGVEPTSEKARNYASEDANRSTVLLQCRVRKIVLERIDEAVADYGMDRSAYVSSLVMGQTPSPPPRMDAGSDALLLTLAMNPVLRAIVDVQKRIEGGEGDLSVLIPELRAIRRAIVMGQLSLRDAYDARLDGRKSDDTWTDNETLDLPKKQAAKAKKTP